MNSMQPAAQTQQKKTRVLIVEDDENTAMAMADLLEDLNCETLVVSEGNLARQKACAFKPEIALLDIDLPGMNGYEVARMLRATAECSSILIIAITAHNEPEDKQKAYRVGMDLHLSKPLQLNFFKELIATFGRNLGHFAPASL